MILCTKYVLLAKNSNGKLHLSYSGKVWLRVTYSFLPSEQCEDCIDFTIMINFYHFDCKHLFV